MPRYRITSPDGRTYEVNAPEGASQADVMAYVQQHHAQALPADSNRGAQLAGRSVAQGAAGTADMLEHAAASLPGMELFHAATQHLPSLRDAVGAYLTQQGVAAPETPAERIGSAGGEALTGTALTMGAGALARAPLLTVNPVIQALGAVGGATAQQATKESGGGRAAQTVAALAGGLAPGAARMAAPMTARAVLRGGEAGRQNVANAIADFGTAGAVPTVGQATQSPLWRGVESILAKLPGSSGVMERRAAQQGQQIGQGVTQLANRLAPRVDATRAGRAIDQGINGEGGFLQRTRGVQEGLYNRLDRHIDPQTRVGVENAYEALQQLNPEIPGAPSLSRYFQNARIKGIQGALESDTQGVPAMLTRDGVADWADTLRASLQDEADRIAQQNVLRTSLGQKPLPVPSTKDIEAHVQARLATMPDNRLPYEALRKTRTLVGQEIADAGIGADVPRSKWNPLYGALSRDMRAAAADAGPEATAAYNRANNYTRAMEGRKAAIAHVVDKDGGPEAIFNAAVSGTKDGATTLRALMRSLPEGSQRQVASAVLQRLGKATNSNQNAAGDVFSSNTFLTNWNKLSPEARGVLFDRFGPEFRAEVNKLARVASNLRDGSKVYANPSGTATTGAQIGGYTALGSTGVGAMMGHPLPLLLTGGGMAGNNLLARFMTSPETVNFLAKRTAVPYGALMPLAQQPTR